MKKKYIAPLVYAESFELAQHVANSCTPIVRLQSGDTATCGAIVNDPTDPDLDGSFIFTMDGYCNKKKDDQYINIDQYCYTNIDTTLGYFGS